MAQTQGSGPGNATIPDGREQRRDPRKRAEFARRAASSEFSVAFRSMEIGQKPVAEVLAILRQVNDRKTPGMDYSKEEAGVRIIFQTYGKMQYSPQAAELLEAAALSIPSLRRKLADDVTTGLEKAVTNPWYVDTAKSALKKLLEPPVTLPEPVMKRLQAVQAMASTRSLPPDGLIVEPAPLTRDPATEKTAGRKAWKGFAIAAGVVLALGLTVYGLSRPKYKDTKPEAAEPAAAVAAPDASPQERDAGLAPQDGAAARETVLHVKPRQKAAKSPRKPAAATPFNALNTTNPPAPVSTARADEGVVDQEAERIAAAIIGASNQEDVDSLFGLLGPVASPDAGRTAVPRDAGATCQEPCRITALKNIASGPDDRKAVTAIGKLAEFERQGTDAASAALDELGRNPFVTNSPKRLDALLMAMPPPAQRKPAQKRQ